MSYRKSALLLPIFILFILFTTNASAETQWQVKIEYPGNWSGSVGGTNSASYDGYGDTTINVNGDIVAAVIQKMDSGSYLLCVEIWDSGGLEEKSCTNAEYGVVSVGASNFGDGGFIDGWFFYLFFLPILLFGCFSYYVSLNATARHNSQNRQDIHTYETKRTNTTSLPAILPPPSTEPPVYTKPSFQLDGFDWLDYKGEKWRRPTQFGHDFQRNWELYIEETFESAISKETSQENSKLKRCKYFFSEDERIDTKSIRCNNYHHNNKFCDEHKSHLWFNQ